MRDAGIVDGDTAIIREQCAANSGEIVVALINDNEATLKYLDKQKDSIVLKPANPDFEDQLYSTGQVLIQGRLVGLIRKY